MGIGGISSAGGYAGSRTAVTVSPDTVGKRIENEISEAQREKQALSSKQDLSSEEKMRKSRELQQEIGSLNAKLRQRLEEADKEQKKKEMDEQIRERENGGEDTEETKDKTSAAKVSGQDVKASGTEDKTAQKAEDKTVQRKEREETAEDTRKIISADAEVKRAKQQERVVARMEEGIVVLKSEIKQDELRGGNADQKREELAKRENRKNQEFPPRKVPEANRITNRPTQANLFGF